MADNTITVMGNLTRDPELRYTPSGAAVANLAIAVSRKWKDRSDEWTEETSFFEVTTWNTLAENVAESLTKGARVIVTGRIEQQSWETPDGEKRSAVKIVADDIGPSLRWATATVIRAERSESSTAQPSKKAPAKTYSEEPF